MNYGHCKNGSKTDDAIKQYLLRSKKKPVKRNKSTKPQHQLPSRNHSFFIEKPKKINIFSTIQIKNNIATRSQRSVSPQKKIQPTTRTPIANSYTKPNAYSTTKSQCKVLEKVQITKEFISNDPLNLSFSRKEPPHFTIVEHLYICNIMEFHKIRETVTLLAGCLHYPACMERVRAPTYSLAIIDQNFACCLHSSQP